MSRRKRQLVAGNEAIIASPALKKLDATLRAVAGKEVALTFTGESGVGKEVLARRAHALSDRRRGPFVPINCVAIPDALFESELFGHEKGAFTGASERNPGKIEAARGGTLFLDEIGEMPLPMQAKLLRFIENHKYMRVGGSTKIDADVRLMFATLRPLEEDVRTGRFRADLFYRLQGVTLEVPPLRERRPEIGPLMRLFVTEMTKKHGVRAPRIGRRARELLIAHDWPGNVRELRNVVETLCLLRDGRPVRPEHLPEAIARTHAARPRPRGRLVLDLDDGLEPLIAQIVQAALEREQGDAAAAARRLKISLRTVQRHLATGRVTRAR